MAKTAYTGVSGVARKNKKIYVGVDGVAKKVKKGYVGVNGVAKQFWTGGTPIGELAVPTSVYLNVNGVRERFTVVQQGRPSTLYDSSCDGTWLLMKNLCTKMKFQDGAIRTNDYSKSNIHTYLNNTFINLFDANIREIIKQVKIPYRTGSGNNTTPVASGANGVQTKVFIPSALEVNQTQSTNAPMPNDGAILEYFNASGSTLNNRRKSTYNGTATIWWTRSPACTADAASSPAMYTILTTGSAGGRYDVAAGSYGVRPMIIVPKDTLVDENFDIIT